MYRIGVAMACYKRPQIAKRLLDSMATHTPYVSSVCIYYQPISMMIDVSHTKGEYPFTVHAIFGKQLHVGRARNEAVSNLIEMSRPDLILLTDDDVIFTEETDLKAMVDLAMKRDTGVVGITRKMHKGIVKEDKDLLEPFPYIGGGWLFRPEIFDKVQLDDDGADELSFTARIYLEGYENYRTKRALAIHTQGKSFNGGIKKSYEDAKEDIDIQVPKTTRYDENHPHIRSKPVPLNYGTQKSTFLSCGADKVITPEGRELHNKNHKRLLSEDI